jgi:hypothetical protein
MKLIVRDLLKLILILSIWYAVLTITLHRGYINLHESLKYFPFHLIMTIGYYAIISVCYKILFIKDCNKEYSELVSEIEGGKEFFIKNKIKYN